MKSLDSILKIRDNSLPAKFHLVKAMVFPVVMYGCESCSLEKTLMLGEIGAGGEGDDRG